MSQRSSHVTWGQAGHHQFLHKTHHTVSCICICDTGAKSTHTLMQQPDTVSMCNTAMRHPYPHATARHSQLHLLGHTAHDLVPLEGVCHVLLSETALLRPSPAHVTSHEGWHHRLGKISQMYKYRYTNVWLLDFTN